MNNEFEVIWSERF